MEKIRLTQGKFAFVDDEDFEELNKHKWHISGAGRHIYAERHESKPILRHILMHRQIMNTPKGMDTDHIDGNGLNNQRGNLRVCTHAENLRNCRRGTSNTTGFKGVSFEKFTGKYRSIINVNGKIIRIGRFVDLEMAARAYDIAAKKYFGEFAVLNFKN